MFVGLLHFVPVSNKMMHYAKQTISGALAPAMNTNGTALYVDLYQIFLSMSPHPTQAKKTGKPIGSSNLRGLTGLTKDTRD